MKYRFFTFFFSLFTCAAGVLSLTACSEEEDTTPSMADKDRLEALIDTDIAKIKQFRDNYGTYILYNFDKNLDFAYQFEQASNWNGASLKMIDKAEASAAVDVLYDNVFSCYSDEYKKKFYPRKLLLVNDIQSSGELGLSMPDAGHHVAVANINSVTFATNALLSESAGQYHRALLADYLVKARGQYPVEEAFFAYSQKDYASLMNSSRKNARQLVAENPDFFYEHGFFFPQDDESTYFPSAEDDVIAFIENMITMDKAYADMLMEKPVMADKMHLLTTGLMAIGVDVKQINPWAEQFVLMEYIQPAVVYAEDVVCTGEEATLNVTIIRGSNPLDHLTVTVNGSTQTVDLKAYDRMRVVIPVTVNGLKKGQNAVELALYEEGSSKPAATSRATATYANMENISGFKIDMEGENEEIYRTLKVFHGEGYPVSENETNPNLTTLSFEKHGWVDRFLEERGGDYRAWKIYKENGMVRRIMAYERGFNEDYTGVEYHLTETYTYEYNENNELQRVVMTTVDGDSEVLVDDVTYVAGRMTRYSFYGMPYEPVYATANGATTRVDCLDESMSGLCFGFTGTEYANPYYISGLPAVIPGSVAEIPLQLLYSQYIFNSLGDIWTSGWQTVQDGNAMAKQATVTYNGDTWTYTFALKTE